MSDLKSSLSELVENLAQAFVLGSPDDLQHLAGLHAFFKKIAEGALAAGKQLPADAAAAAAGVIEKIIFQEAADPVAALAVAMKTVSFLQETLVHHRDDDEATLPKELGVGSGASKPEHRNRRGRRRCPRRSMSRLWRSFFRVSRACLTRWKP